MARLGEGEAVGDYIVASFLAEGGNGEVYVARERETDRRVALKMLTEFSAAGAVRFEREVRVLQALDHPGIVRLFAHGICDGRPYLVMELLTGETLEQRIERGPFAPAEAVAVVRDIAAALAQAHARGVIHRDLKPGNVFLSGTEQNVKLLDFGIARHVDDDRKVTRTGTLIGTPAYMAPEQARGESTIDARADVFALGCVLYEALSGRQAFAGEQFIAVLAKILLDEPTPLRDVVSGITPALETIVTRMLSKDAAMRPSDGAAVVDALRDVEVFLARSETDAVPEQRVAAITAGEQRLVSVILARRSFEPATDATIPAGRSASDEEPAFREVADRHGAKMATLADGTILFALSGHGHAGDQAARAAACAMAVSATAPDARVALATGRADTTAPWPVGPVVERAASLLNGVALTTEIAVDELTAGLLAARYHVEGGVLRGARDAQENVRTLLGRPMPCVGREKELALVEATLAEVTDEPAARAVLIVAGPGFGKSRLQHEFVERVKARGDVTVLIARTDPVASGSAFSIARQLVSVGTSAGSVARTRDAIRSRLDALAVVNGSRVSEFLASIVGAEPSADPTPQMLAARTDPSVMAEWYRRSFLEWIAAEIAMRPVLVAIEDLHWGDATSVGWLDEMLRDHRDAPVMVVATARPEVAATFPEVWSSASLQWMRLGGLPRRAAERLVHAALGRDVEATDVARIIERADGNAFYLEELVRSVVERQSTALPETVLAMAHARLDALAPDSRRLLRAASVFGERFWARGVDALCGGESSAEALAALVRKEVIVRSSDSRFAGEVEYAFRHGLLREAAYASLPAGDATRAHRRVGEWLEAAGERDPRVLAEHFERGGDTERAIAALERASEAAFHGSDFAAARALALRGIAAGASGTTLGLLHCVRAGVAVWNADWSEAMTTGRAACEVLSPDDTWWWYAASMVMFAASTAGDRAVAAETMSRLLAAPDPAELTGQYALGMATVHLGLFEVGQFEMTRKILDRVDAFVKRSNAPDPVAVAWVDTMHASSMLTTRRQHALDRIRIAIDAFRLAGHSAGVAGGQMYLAIALTDIGRFDDAERLLRQNIAWAVSARSFLIESRSRLMLERIYLRTHRGPADPAYVEGAHSARDQTLRATGIYLRAVRALEDGRLDEAEALARGLVDVSLMGAQARVILARVSLARGRPGEALEILDRPGKFSTYYSFDRADMELARIDALVALGEAARSHDALRAARDRITASAYELQDPEFRASFMTAIAPNAAILARAEALDRA